MTPESTDTLITRSLLTLTRDLSGPLPRDARYWLETAKCALQQASDAVGQAKKMSQKEKV